MIIIIDYGVFILIFLYENVYTFFPRETSLRFLSLSKYDETCALGI